MTLRLAAPFVTPCLYRLSAITFYGSEYLTCVLSSDINVTASFSFKDNLVSSIASEDRQKLEKLDADIRTQGLVGVLLLLTTLGAMIYHARTADVNIHKGIADTALVAFENAKTDLQSLFDGKDLEHNLMRLKRRMTFGSDFVPAWMIYAQSGGSKS